MPLPAEFEFDEDHSYFMVRLPIHPAALEVADSVAGVGTEPITPPVGTKSGPSRDQVLLLRQAVEETGIATLTQIGRAILASLKRLSIFSGARVPPFGKLPITHILGLW